MDFVRVSQLNFMRESFLDTLFYEEKICLYLTNQKMLSTYKGEHHWTAEGDRGCVILTEWGRGTINWAALFYLKQGDKKSKFWRYYSS